MPGAFHQYRLPRGRHTLSESQIRENQRWRLLGACAEIIAAPGYGQLSVRSLTREASVSKATFYRHFRDLNECVVATHAMAAENALGTVLQVCDAARGGGSALPEGVNSIFDLFAEEPALGHVLTDGALLDVPGIYAARVDFTSRLAEALAVATDAGSETARGSGRRLCLHRVRAAIGCLSLLLEKAAPALSAARPELTRLLEA